MRTLTSLVCLALAIHSTNAKFECPTPVVCDPSLESEDYVNSAHYATSEQCQQACQIGHPYNPCKFFTWIPNAAPGVTNCFQMSACTEMSDPITGATSGAWSCDDEDIFCGPVADIPIFDDKKTVWTCDHNVHPYGNADLKIFQDVTCYTTCPSFKEYNGTKEERSDLVVASTCRFDRTTNQTGWSQADPGNVMDTAGNMIMAADMTPNPACGCEDLVLPGQVAEEDGKIWQCLYEPSNGIDTIIKDDNECQLICDQLVVFDLFCSEGMWSIDYLTSAEDIFCHGATDGYTEISTYWPTNPPPATTTTQAPSTSSAAAPTSTVAPTTSAAPTTTAAPTTSKAPTAAPTTTKAPQPTSASTAAPTTSA